MPNIIISPSYSNPTGIPRMDFVGASGSGISLQVLRNGGVSFVGTSGALFSISDSLIGSLMSVTDIGGVPILEVFDSDKVVMGRYGSNTFVVSGSGASFGTDFVYRDKVLYVSGNTRFDGHLFSGTTNLADIYYPRSNPSGYITGVGGTGSLASITQPNSLSGYINSQDYITGQKLFNLVNGLSGQANINFATVGNLQSTGRNLYNLTTALSGQFNTNFATVNNLTSTGNQLFALINSLSGYLGNVSGGLQTQIASVNSSLATTGSNLFNLVTGLSGQSNINFATIVNLASTGSQVWNAANNNGVNLSGNSSATGTALITRMNSIGSTISGNLTTTGVTLISKISSLSGYSASALNLQSTGQQLFNLVTGFSGQANINFATISNLASTGQQAWNAANNNGINLSGNLYSTGSLLSAVRVTGSNIINSVNLSGIGGTQVFSSGSYVFISGSPTSLNNSIRQSLTPSTEGQTVFTIAGGYSPNALDVYFNGSKLQPVTDVTTSSGSTITLQFPSTLTDVIDVVGVNVISSIGTVSRQSFVATAGQTTFSISGGYQPNAIDVYKNGTKLRNGVDVTVTSGTVVVLAIAASLNDIIDVTASQQAASNGVTNLGTTQSSTTVTVTSDTGGSAVLPAATTSNAGILSAADKVSLRNYGMKNRIINGSMDIFQRGTSISSGLNTITYVADRWIAYATGAAVTCVRSAGDGDFQYCLANTGAVGNTNVNFVQRIEVANAHCAVGTVMTVSFRAYSTDAATINYAVDTANTADVFTSTTALVNGAAGSVLAATWKTLSFSFTTNAACKNGFQITIGLGACGSGTTRAITGVQLELGTQATEFEHRPYGTELALCQRYYQSLNPNNIIGYCQSSDLAFFGKALPITIRTTPSVTFIGANSSTVIYGAGAITTSTTAFLDTSSSDNIGFSINTPAVLTVGQACRIQAGLALCISAEL